MTQTAPDAYNEWLAVNGSAREDYPDVANDQILVELEALRHQIQHARLTRFEEMMSIEPGMSLDRLMVLHEEIHAMIQLHGYARF